MKNKVETAYVIQRDDGLFANKKHRWVVSIRPANFYQNERLAEIDVKMHHSLENCKPVKVEIRVVE